jgi:hypothetical protein
MSKQSSKRIEAAIIRVVDGKPVVHDIELDVVGVRNSVTGTVAISEKILVEGHDVPDGGPYLLKSSYGEERVNVIACRFFENSSVVAF